MKTIKTTSSVETFHRCRCGWKGTFKQLSVWVQKNKIISKICPACGSKTQQCMEQSHVHWGQLKQTVH